MTKISTVWLLMAQYEGLPVIPAASICRDYFSHLSYSSFIRKIDTGEIALPTVRIENSSKAARGVHLLDLAAYIDARRAEALAEFERMQKARSSK